MQRSRYGLVTTSTSLLNSPARRCAVPRRSTLFGALGAALLFASAAAAQPAPTATTTPPAGTLIGESFDVEMQFSNASATATDVGYGPFIDIVVPVNGADGAAGMEVPDGVTFVNATYLDASVQRSTHTFPDSGGGTGCVDHPVAFSSPGVPLEVCGTAADQLVVLRLPFGSFVPDQPEAELELSFDLSELADIGTVLPLSYRAGFRFGADPLDNPASDPVLLSSTSTDSATWPSASVTPSLISVRKEYLGPENETATGPNFAQRFRLALDLAAGQTITEVNLFDLLPDSYAYLGLVSSSPVATLEAEPPLGVPALPPNATLQASWTSLTGTTSNTDAQLTFEFFVPRDDANATAVLSATTGNDVTAENNVQVTSDWFPVDERDEDDGGGIAFDDPGPEHTLSQQAIAVQKSRAFHSNTGTSGLNPGDVLRYTLQVQISDFFALSGITLTDVLSDGQSFDASFTPTLTVTEHGATSSGDFDISSFTVFADKTGIDALPNTGETTLTFDVSGEMLIREPDDLFLGGCVPPTGTGGPAPDCGTYDQGASTAVIVYRAIIDENFTDDFPSGDPSVDQGDRINNAVVVNSTLHDVADLTISAETEDDNSGTAGQLAFGSLSKTIYAIDGNTTLPSPLEIFPGNEVTYRLKYSMPSADYENLELTDYLPLPVFDATEVVQLLDAVSADVPPAGRVRFGPDDTLRARLPTVPSLQTNAAANRVTLTYGDFDETGSTPVVLDLLFTVTASDKAFADDLLLTNQLHLEQASTNGASKIADAIVQFRLRQPQLTFSKGVVDADGPNATFDPATVGPDLLGTVSSDALASTPIDSNVADLDAGDLVTYALVIENRGGAGAFDIIVTDTLPTGMAAPVGGIGLVARRGDGTILTATGLSGSPSDEDLFTAGIELTDPDAFGAARSYDATAGDNVVVITYQLQIDGSVEPDTVLSNGAQITQYGGADGSGPSENHVTQGAALVDDATVTIASPTLLKSITLTSEAHTPDLDPNRPLAVGETVLYRLVLTLPEGLAPTSTVVDQVSPALEIISVDSVFGSSGVTTTYAGGFNGVRTDAVIAPDGLSVSLSFDTVTNTNRNDEAADTVTIDYRARVRNSGAGVAGAVASNSATWNWSTGSLNASAPSGLVVEPELEISKSVNPGNGDAGDIVQYSVTVQHSGASTTDAFDLVMTDLINDPDLQLVNGSVSSTLGTVVQGNGGEGVVEVQWDTLADGSSDTVTFDVLLLNTVLAGDTLLNTASLVWDSLPSEVAERDYGPISDGATVTVGIPTLGKSVFSTSEAHTGTGQYNGSLTDLVPGEEVTFRITATLPEGVTAKALIIDNLPATANGVLQALSASVISVGTNLTAQTPSPTPVLSDASLSDGFDDRVEWDFGQVTNAPDGVVDGNDQIVVEVVALVPDITANRWGRTLTNTALFDFDGALQPSASAQVELVEPRLRINKSGDETTGDAGDTVTFTVKVDHRGGNNSTAEAFDVVVSDTIPTGMTYVAASLTDTGTVAPSLLQESGGVITAEWDSIDEGEIGRFTFQVTIDLAVNPGDQLNNQATSVWDSLPADSDPPGERDGSQNNSHPFTVTEPGVDKSVLSTSEPSTGIAQDGPSITDLTIGEIVTYRMVVTFPEGTIANTSFVDELPRSSARLEALSSDVIRVGTSLSGAMLPTVGQAGLLEDSSGDGDGLLDKATWTLGTLTNTPDGTSNSEDQIEFEVVAQVVDVTENTGADLDEANVATLSHDDGTAVGMALVDIVEPLLNLEKNASSVFVDAGDTVTFTLTLSHDGESKADAFDLRLSDAIPSSGFDWVNDSTATSTCADFTIDSTNLPTVSFHASALPLAIGSCTISYDLTVKSTVQPGESYDNSADVWFDSQPTAGDETRTGSDLAMETVTILAPGLVKITDASSLSDTETDQFDLTRVDLAIGEQVTYELTVIFPEGVTEDSVVTDLFPADAGTGLIEAIGASVVTIGGNLTATGAGTPVLSDDQLSDGYDDTVTIDFGQVTNAPDGVNDEKDRIVITVTGVVVNEPANAAGTVLTNYAELAFATGDPLSDTAEVDVVEPTLVLDKQMGPVASHNVPVTLSIENTGTAPAYDVLMEDLLPDSDWDLTSFSADTPPTGFLLEVADEGSQLRVTFRSDPAGSSPDNSVEPGETVSASFSIDALRGAQSPVEITNVADETGATSLPGVDVNEREQPDRQVEETLGLPILEMTKTATLRIDADGSGTVTPGDTLRYDITLINSGNGAATNVVLTDTPDVSTLLVVGTVNPSNAGVVTTGNTPGDTTVRIDWTQVAGGTSPTVVFDAVVSPTIGAGVVAVANQALVTSTEVDDVPSDDPGTGPVDDPTVTPVEAVPNLQITKTEGGGGASPGSAIFYQLGYSNVGNQDATGVTISETVPAHTVFDAALNAGGWSCADGSTAGTPCSLTLGGVAAGFSAQVTFGVRVISALPEGITQVANAATIADDGTNGVDPDTSDNTAADTTPISATPVLQLTKDDGGATAVFGTPVVYTLAWLNAGNQAASGVVLTETVPANTTFDATASLPSVWSCADGSVAGTECTIDVGTVAASAGGSATFAVTLLGNASDAISLSNSASIADDGLSAAGIVVSDNASDTTPINAPKLTKTLLSSPTATIGDEVQFRIELVVPEGANTPNVVLTDTLPAGLLAVRQDSVSTGSIGVTGSTTPVITSGLFTWNLGTVTNADTNPGNDEVLTFDVTVQVRNDASSVVGAVLSNQADLNFGGETRSDSASITVVEPQLTLFKEFTTRTAGGNETVTVKVTLHHEATSGADAHDVELTDLLGSDLTWVGNVTAVNGPTPTVDTGSLPSVVFSTPLLELANYPEATPWEFTFDVQTAPTVTSDQPVTNQIVGTWTSQAGDPGLTDGGDPGSSERTGDDTDPGGALNDYLDRDSAQLNNGVLYTFEDLRNDPDRNNDFDYNDLTLRFDIEETVDESGNWTRLEIWVEALARGASFVHVPYLDLGLEGPVDITARYYDTAGTLQFSEQTQQDGELVENVLLFTDSWTALPAWGGPTFFPFSANTDEEQLGANRIAGATTHLVIDVGDPSLNPREDDDPFTAHLDETLNHVFGPWIAVNDTGESIYHRWRLRSASQDLVTPGLYGFLTPLLGFPLDQATDFDTTWEWPVERVPIWDAYPGFVNHVYSGQTAFNDWDQSPAAGQVWPVDGARGPNPTFGPPIDRGTLPAGSFAFEHTFTSPVSSAPAIGDLDGDGLPEVVVGAFVNEIVVHEGDGDELRVIDAVPGTETISVSSVVLADLDNDGDDEILRGYDDAGGGVLRAFDGDGTPGATFTVGGTIKGTPAIADVLGDALPEVFVLSGDTKLYGFTAAGVALSGFPVDVGGTEDLGNSFVILPSPVVAQVDGSGAPEIVAVSNDGVVHVFDTGGNELTGFPVDLERSVLSTPAVGDLDGGARGSGSNEIVIADAQGGVTALSSAGVQLWQSSRALGGPSSPALAQLDGSGGLEVVVGSFDGKIYAFDASGNAVAGWPVTTASGVQSSPAAVDLEGDGNDEIFVGSFDTKLYGLDGDGSALMTSDGGSFPVSLSLVVFSSPSVADLDGDGHAEVVVGSYDRQLYAIEAAASLRPYDRPWPQFRGGRSNAGIGEAVSVPLSDLEVTVNDGAATAPAGAANTWTVTVSNVGPDAVTGAAVTDTLPALTDVSWTCAVSAGACSAPSGIGSLALTVDLPVGEQATITITGTTDPSATGDVTLSAAASTPLGTADADPTDNAASDVTTLVATGDVEVTMFNPDGTYTPETTVSHELTVANDGPSDLTGIAVVTTLPASVTGLSWTCSGSSGGVCPASGSGNVTADVDLPVGAQVQFLIDGTVESGTTGQLVAGASATVGAPAVDPNLADNDDTEISDLLEAFDAPRVDSVSDLATATPLAACRAFTGDAPGSLKVGFSEEMKSVSGSAPGDFDNPVNYLLVATGADKNLQTTSCTTLSGDDVAVPLLGALGVDGNTAVELSLDGPAAGQLEPGVHRLLICEDVTDLADLPLDGDGDGIGGDTFSFDFRVDPGNAIDDGAFDCDLGDWVPTSADPAEVSYDATTDVDGSSLSGSTQLQDLTAGTDYRASRCVPLGGGEGLSWQVAALFDGGVGVEADLVVDCELFDGAACAGTSLGSDQNSTLLSDTAGAWQRFDGAFADDPAATSAQCTVSIEPVSGLAWTAWVDEARFTRRLFATGFESGDTAAWSTTVP